MEHTYEVHNTDDEVIMVTTDLDIEIWIEEYEAELRAVYLKHGIPVEFAPTVAEYDIVETPDSTETEEWWAA